MVQALLEDRFRLKAHRETRDRPVYHLVLNKRGPKLSADQTPPDPRQDPLLSRHQPIRRRLRHGAQSASSRNPPAQRCWRTR
jgi:uncharacterized protein (TIGR03435 family)